MGVDRVAATVPDRTVYYRVADPRVPQMIELARGLLGDNAEHVAACHRIDGET